MLDWKSIQDEYDSIGQRLADSSLAQQERIDLQKKVSQFLELLTLHKQITDLEKLITTHQKQVDQEKDPELKQLYIEEIDQDTTELKTLQRELDQLLYPADERDRRSVFLELRSGAGGQEAALFAADLFKMYTTYALARYWKVSIVEESKTDIGGYSRLIVHIKGKNVFKFFKFESGVHRVQRVPKTEGAGRVHTSTVTVAVMPEADDVEISINPKDLRIDVFRSSGAGGQHVNTTDSAVRITHLPTGVVVSCQDERSQIKNRARAMKVLQSRLLEAERERKEAEMSAQRKKQVGTGERAEKIRTYNFPQNRVTDHRVGLTLKKLDLIMQGDLDDLLNPLIDWEIDQRRKQGSLFEHLS